MLRKSYRLMQRTKTLIEQTKAEVGTLYTRTFDRTLPREFTCCPPDVWMGDAGRGAEMVSYIYGLRPEKVLGLFSPAMAGMVDARFHGFGWLTDLVADGSAEARRVAVICLEAWIQQNTAPDDATWSTPLLAERLLRWTGAYAFYFPVLDPVQNEMIVASYGRQAQILRSRLHSIDDAFLGIQAAAGLISAGIALGHDTGWTHIGLQTLEGHARTMILSDGGPHTRRPSDLPVLLRLLLDVRLRLEAAALPVPAFLAHAIDRVVPALQFFRLGDKRLAVFHGGAEGDARVIDDLIQKSGVPCGAPQSLPYAGFERLQAGDTRIIVDTGSIDAASYPNQHASVLALEMSIGAERVFVNCGQHAHDPMWRDLLSATAAHSTLSLEGEDNVVMMRGRGRSGGGTQVTLGRAEDGNGVLVQAEHSGYMTRNGFSHTRKLYLEADGETLRGADDLSTAIPPITPITFTTRFHLHPLVDAVATQGGGVLLRLSSGDGWMFQAEGGTVTLEDSVYLGATGLPQKTRQIVVSGRIYSAGTSLRWGLSRNHG